MTKDVLDVLYVMPSPSSTGGMRMITQMYFNAEVFKKPGYHFFDSYYSWGEGKFIRFFQNLTQKINFAWVLLTKKIDLVYVMSSSYWGFYDKVLFCLIARLLGKKSVLNPVGGHFIFFHERNSFNRLMVPKMLRIPNGVISGTNYWFNYFMDSFRIKQLRNIPNPVIVPTCSRGASTKNKPLTITFLSRIEKEKGAIVFSEVVKESIESGKDYHFVIAGKGPALDQVKRNLSKYSETDQLDILGFISEDEKKKIFEKTDIYILPTEFEVLPVSLLEAMSYGCVVISTNVGGIPDAVEDGKTGILLEEISEDAILGEVLKLDKNREIMYELGKNARERMQKTYSLPSVLKQQRDFFLQITHSIVESNYSV